MKIDLSSFLAQRDALRRICHDAREPVEALDVSVVIEQLTIAGGSLLEDVRAKLENRVFRVLVAGEFNAGKSFFINTMLDGWKRQTDPATGKVRWTGLLGVDIVPATTLLTELRCSTFESAQIDLRSGQSIPLSITDVPAFTDLARFGRGSTAHLRNARIFESLAQRLGVPLSQLGDVGPQASATISEWLFETFDRAVVNLNAPLLKDGVVIVDSPGLGAVFQEHETITEGEMRRADAIVFLIASSNPLTERAVKFLQTSRAFVDNFFFVQTKTDHLSAEDVQRAKERNLRILSELLGLPEARIRYRLVSAHRYRAARDADADEAMDQSGFPSLVEELGAFLAAERGTPTLLRETEIVGRVLAQAERQCDEATVLSRATMLELDAEADRAHDDRAELGIAALKAAKHIERACNEALDAVDGRLTRLKADFSMNVEQMQGTGGVRGLVHLGMGRDAELAILLRNTAYTFAEGTVHPDILPTRERLLIDVRSLLAEGDMLTRMPNLRFSVPRAKPSTNFIERLANRHILQYTEYAEEYARIVVEELRAQINQHFTGFGQSVADRFATGDSELAHREKRILRYRNSQREVLTEERALLVRRADEVRMLRASLAELTLSVGGS